jgi:hypothetical protein
MLGTCSLLFCSFTSTSRGRRQQSMPGKKRQSETQSSATVTDSNSPTPGPGTWVKSNSPARFRLRSFGTEHRYPDGKVAVKLLIRQLDALNQKPRTLVRLSATTLIGVSDVSAALAILHSTSICMPACEYPKHHSRRIPWICLHGKPRLCIEEWIQGWGSGSFVSALSIFCAVWTGCKKGGSNLTVLEVWKH